MTQNSEQPNYNQTQSLEDLKAKTPQNADVQQKLKELEAQVYQTSKENTFSETATESSLAEQITEAIKTVRNWFNNLPQVAKLIVGIVAILIGFSILNFFLRLITSLVSLAILSLILYGLYKYLFSSSKS